MKYMDLQLEDFPELNLDPQKFTEWKEAKDNETRNWKLVALAVLVIAAITYLTTGTITLTSIPLLALIIVPWLSSKKPNQLGKELGITTEMYNDAWSKRKAIQ